MLITDKFASRPVVSPDGKLIAYSSRDEQTRAWNIALSPFEGGDPIKLFDFPQTANQEEPVSWTADGHALTYINGRGNLSNIWLQPVDGGKPRQLTDFHTNRIFSFRWSQDGKWLAASRGIVNAVADEAEATIGGGTRSAELTLPGFLHDICSAVACGRLTVFPHAASCRTRFALGLSANPTRTSFR